MLCDSMGCTEKGGRVPLGISLIIALAISLISVGVLVMAGVTKLDFGIFLPLFAGPLAFFALRTPAAARVHAAWPLFGFPILIGLTIFCTLFLGATRTSSSGGGGSTMMFLLPVLYVSTLPRKSKCENSRSAMRLLSFLFIGVGLLALFGLAFWRVWNAYQSGTGPAYAAIGDSANMATFWMGVMMLVGASALLTRPLRIEDNQSQSRAPMKF